MNIKPVTVLLVSLMVVLIAAIAIAPLQAQNTQNTQNNGNGLRLGPAPAQNPLATPASPNPVQGMTTPPIQGMTTPPILPMGGDKTRQLTSIALPQFNGGNANPAVSVLPPGGTIFVPAGTLVIENSPGMEPGAFLTAPEAPTAPASSSPGSRGGGTSLERSSRRPNGDQQSSTKQDVSRLELGTPQDKVIEKYGNPIAYIMNMNGETLYFNGGVVVFVKDGVVATPGR